MVDPEKFAKDPDAKWQRGASIEEASRIAAAYDQHQAVIEVREKLTELKKSAKWFASELGQNPQMVRRKLDGGYPGLPEDVLDWAIVLVDVMVIYASGNVEYLLQWVDRVNHRRHLKLPGVPRLPSGKTPIAVSDAREPSALESRNGPRADSTRVQASASPPAARKPLIRSPLRCRTRPLTSPTGAPLGVAVSPVSRRDPVLAYPQSTGRQTRCAGHAVPRRTLPTD